jgi:riboflavin-specific deaminase-like protein
MTAPCRPDETALHQLMPAEIRLLGPDTGHWSDLVAARAGHPVAAIGRVPVYGPLVAHGAMTELVIGQFGQSLDGRIATPTGESKYLNGPGGLVHLHRLRALVDAVVVGVTTVIVDDPLLTVRHVAGDNPARVVIDPNGRVPLGARIFADDGVRRLIVTAEETKLSAHEGVEIIRLSRQDGRIAPESIVAALRAAGLRQVLVEGGAETVSRFLAAECLDRLHVTVAPVLVGGGRSGVTLDHVRGLADCLRPAIDVHRLGDDILFDCRFAPVRQDVRMPSSP